MQLLLKTGGEMGIVIYYTISFISYIWKIFFSDTKEKHGHK